jgi:hypothetical protein
MTWTLVFFFLHAYPPQMPRGDYKIEIPVSSHEECVERAYFMGEAAEHECLDIDALKTGECWFLCLPGVIS